MIKISVSGGGFEDLANEALKEMKPAAEAVVLAGVNEIAKNAKSLLSRNGTGRTLKRFVKTKKRGVRDTVLENSSMPGAPPAYHIGDLQRSIQTTRPKWKGWSVSASVGPKGRLWTAIGYILEYGGRVGRYGATFIASRPYMRPAEKMSQPEIDRVARVWFELT